MIIQRLAKPTQDSDSLALRLHWDSGVFSLARPIARHAGVGNAAMSHKSPTGFFTSLIAEVVIIAAVVSLLPRVPLSRAEPTVGQEPADERPSLTLPTSTAPRPQPLPPPADNWRTAVSRPEEGPRAAAPLDLPPPDPDYVERRLDQASQQLLEGVSHYLSRQAQELIQPAADAEPLQSAHGPAAYRQWPH
jgi:hypothetical protein